MVDVMEDVLENRTSEDFVYRDFCDGSYVRNHPVLKLINDKLLISFYFDELEVANPLGSKRGKHKLGKSLYSLRVILCEITYAGYFWLPPIIICKLLHTYLPEFFNRDPAVMPFLIHESFFSIFILHEHRILYV